MVSMQALVKSTISVSQVKPVLINAMAEIFKLSLTPIKLDEAQEIYVASPSFVRSP